MQSRFSFPLASVIIVAILLVAVGTGLIALLGIDHWGERGTGLSDRFSYDLEPFTKTDPALVGYSQTGQITVPLTESRAVAVGPDDRVFVAGDRQVCEFAADGQKVRQFPVLGVPGCIAVGGAHHATPGRLYVGMKDHVEIYGSQNTREAAWTSLGSKALLTSIAVGENDVFVADAGNRIVLRYDPSGKLLSRIGARDESRNIPGFVIPSPCFDLAMAPDGLLRVVNPGGHAVQAYTLDGDLEASWGQSTFDIRGFSGCCNPANIAILPDGRVVTAEKGIPRVKLYTADGQFVCVVAPPETLLPNAASAAETRTPHKLKILDVAADSHGRILVLDPGAKAVRIFEEKKNEEKKK